jgi:PAS domain-containing protein
LLQALAGADLHCETLANRLIQERANWQHLFDRVPVACLTTDRSGIIIGANESAARLLNITAKNLADRLLLHFVDDRGRFATLLGLAPFQQDQQCTLTIRPRERKPIEMDLRVTLCTPGDASTLLWFLAPPSRDRVSTPPEVLQAEPAGLEQHAG